MALEIANALCSDDGYIHITSGRMPCSDALISKMEQAAGIMDTKDFNKRPWEDLRNQPCLNECQERTACGHKRLRKFSVINLEQNLWVKEMSKVFQRLLAQVSERDVQAPCSEVYRGSWLKALPGAWLHPCMCAYVHALLSWLLAGACCAACLCAMSACV